MQYVFFLNIKYWRSHRSPRTVVLKECNPHHFFSSLLPDTISFLVDVMSSAPDSRQDSPAYPITTTPIRPRGLTDLSTRRVSATFPTRERRNSSYQPPIISTSTDPEPPPQHLSSPEDLHDEALYAALFFCNFNKQHRLCTPRSRDFYQRLEDASRACLSDPSCRDHRVLFVALNQTLHSAAFLAKDSSTEERIAGALNTTSQKLAEALRQIKESRYMADYGDYVGSLCTLFRFDCGKQKLSEQEQFTGGRNWAMVDQTLELEDKLHQAWERNNRNGEEPDRPTTLAIFSACNKLGTDYAQMRFAIHWYSTRNLMSHSNIGDYIKGARWTELGDRLLRDLADVPSIFGDADRAMMTKVLETIRDRYFTYLCWDNKIESALATGITAEKAEKIELQKLENQRKEQRRKAGGSHP
ncbi:MAG: hypothetical protein Q9183_005325 [Haloplaca sp. 2 TL-2023]